MFKIGRFLLILWVSMASQLLAGTVYYVATNGNDSYNGLYPSYTSGSNGPFRTLGKAANTVRPGDTVQIRGGIYQEVSSWSTDGTQANPITITNYSGETAVIDGNNNTIPAAEYDVLLAIKGDWYTVSNLEVRYSGYYGLMASGEHCTLDNIYCHHSWAAGITTSGSYALVQNCRAWYNSTRHEFGAGDKWSTGISIMGPEPYYSTIRNCTAWENWGQGIKAAISHYSTVEDCVAYNNMYNFYVRDSQHCLFQRNISYNTPGNLLEQYFTEITILVGDETHAPQSSDNTFINNFAMGGQWVISLGSGVFENGLFANNTIVNASNVFSPPYTVRIGKGTYTNARFENNIILQEDAVAIAINGATGITFGYNNWSKTPSSNCRGTGDVTGDPQLAKTGPTGPGLLTPAWFKILGSSPARDQARVLSEVAEDFFKNPRGAAPDMGAHEFSNGTSSLTASATGTPTTGQAPLAVDFTGSASGGTSPYSYSWTFGDGGSSTTKNPSHTYLSADSYTATLTVTDSLSATASKSLTITVTSAADPLAANASASPTSGQAPLTVSFTGSATGGTSPYSYRWAFGDGGSAATQSPSHTYSDAGSYTATLTVTDSLSATASKSLTITATSAPSELVATASASPTSGPAPLAVSFTGGASGGTPPYSYNWDFGDGVSSLSQNPGHVYSTLGSYVATLTVTDYFSASANAVVNISVVSTTTAVLGLSAVTGAPAPGQGGTTNPTPGNHSYSIGSAVKVDSIPNTDYRFSRWSGDVIDASMFSLATTITLDTNKSLLATFCTKCADVNGDLKITPSDAQLAFDLYLGRTASPTWCELENADVNCSGTKLVPKITPADAQIIFRKYLRKGTYSSTCSGTSRAAAALQQQMPFSDAAFTIDSSFLTSGGDILIPIIVKAPSEIGAFGFDLAFPSDQWTYVGLEATDLTNNYEQLAGNVLAYQASDSGRSAADVPNNQFLRVGGYKTGDDKNASVGVLVILVFRPKTGFADPSEISIIAAYDDIQNASIHAGNGNRLRNDERRAENRRPADERRGKAISRKSDF